MFDQKKSAFTRAGLLGFVAAGLTTLSLTGCFDSGTDPKADAPVITAHPTNKTFNLNMTTSVTFAVTATGEALSYQWIRGTSDTLAGDTAASLVITSATLDDNGTTYKVVVRNEGGFVVSNPATLTVRDLFIARAVLRDTGEAVYSLNCAGCHGQEGQGERGPQVANSSFVMQNRELSIQLILRGNYATPPTVDPVVVNGVEHAAGGMPGWKDALSDLEIAGVLTYFRSVLNDTLVTNCNPDSLDANNFPICDRTARTAIAMDLDSVAVWEVAAVRDTLPPGE